MATSPESCRWRTWNVVVSASGTALGWIRTAEGERSPLVGSTLVDGDGNVPFEGAVPGSDPFPQLAVTDEPIVIVVEGAAPCRLVLHRRAVSGWLGPVEIDVP